MGNRDSHSIMNTGGIAKMLGCKPGSYEKKQPKKNRWIIEVEVIDQPTDKDSYLGRKDVVSLLNLSLDGAATSETSQAKIRILAVRQEGVIK